MLNKKLESAINDQIQRELASAYIYLSMAAYFEANTLPGFANWMRIQFHEEQAHAFKFFDFVYDRGGVVELQPIEGPPIEFDSPIDVFEQTLAHEQKVTGHINDLDPLLSQLHRSPGVAYCRARIIRSNNTNTSQTRKNNALPHIRTAHQ